MTASVSGVAIGPGDTTFTRMPLLGMLGSVPAERAQARMNRLLLA
ncbi:hypothetical protein LJR009_003794 [Bosea sp. LjRoot9]